MFCEKCGIEIEIGTVFCKKCGEPIQMVPDYNILEDDFLVSLLDEKKEQKQAPEMEPVVTEESSEAEATGFQKIWNNKKYRNLLLVACVAVIVVIAAVSLYLTSYAHYLSKGHAYDEKMEYAAAIEWYEKAIAKDEDKAAAKLAAAQDYIRLERYEEAERYLNQVIEKEPANLEAYRILLSLYLTTGNYDALDQLKESVTEQSVLDLLNENLVEAPVFSERGGKFDDDVTIELFAKEGKVYYTLDGSDPTEGGILYSEPFTLTEGVTTVKAVCEKEDKTSEVIQEKYKITYKEPEHPQVSPSGGSFSTPSLITIEVPEGASVYYTWDGTTPTVSSAKYTGAIEMPEGNNILSLILVDKHGKTSDVMECNYKYIPE